MNELRVSDHALERFKAETRDPEHAGQSDAQIIARLLAWWGIGQVQTESQYGWAHKFAKYGLEDAEHRRTADWILTRVEDTIVTVHFKTSQERRRDKRRRQAANRRRRPR